MARSPIALHPSVREQFKPRVSAAALAEYMILRPEQQDTILHNCRFQTGPVVGKYGDAMRALKAYNTNRLRPNGDLDVVKKALAAKAGAPDTRPYARDEALRNVEAIALFQTTENALGMRGLPLLEARRFEPMSIEGVAVSVQPDFLISPVGGENRIGALMLRLQKAPDPSACRREATKERRGEHRREMGRYMIAMMQLLLEQQAADLGAFDRDICFVADVRLGERISAGTDHSARLRSIQSACKQIATLWDSIIPRESIRRKRE